jgi:suppressor for copper-sensitivity B
MSKSFFQLLFLSFLSLLYSAQALADSGGWVYGEHVKARLVGVLDDGSAAQPGARRALLEVRLADGWHSYWKVPGDSGLPPRFDWEKSENLKDINLAWPYPVRIDEFGLQIFGYKGEVAWPVSFTALDVEKPMIAALDLEIMVCHEICIPEALTIKADLTNIEAAPVKHARRLFDFKSNLVPSENEAPSLKIETATLGPDALVLNVYSHKGFDGVDVFAFSEDIALTGIPQATIDPQDPRKAMIIVPKPPDVDDFAGWMEGRELDVTLVAGRGALTKKFVF